jgi:prepilin-type N-terminal cleavage/methylation domain-containing protein
MRRLLHDESGFTLTEMLVASAVMLIVLAGLSNVFVSGLRASSTTNATLASQTSVHVAFDRLEYETRCASQATLLSGGTGVVLTLPTQCSHSNSTNLTWCVTGDTLVRETTSSCTGTGETFASDVTSPAPFSCLAPVGSYPRLQVDLDVNSGATKATAVSATDTIAMRNSALTTTTSAACS